MLKKLDSLEQRFIEIEKDMSDPEIFSDQEQYKKLAKVRSDLHDIVLTYREYKKNDSIIKENSLLLVDADSELRLIAQEEIKFLETEQERLFTYLQLLLLPKDPFDEKNTILEIRAGTGGEEAALFVADLFRMYSRYAERHNWSIDVLSVSDSSNGGYKEIIALIAGDHVYSKLKFEAGTHRVQRVPTTESQGRIHTSAVTVAIMPEADEVDISIKPEDIRLDVFRSSGPGGQSVNTTDSAVRLTHIPTGIVVTCQDEKSQHKNRAKAMKVLLSRLLQSEQDKYHQEMAENRKQQVGSGDRSERIRTYNFPQSRVTDHRINLTLYKLDLLMDGDLEELLSALIADAQAQALRLQSNV
ncbi:MAG: peptide chain release factor 1 [Desulfovibrionaceae bacterium]